MKVNEIIGRQEQLDEFNLKHAAAAGIVGASMMGLAHNANTPQNPSTQRPSQIVQQAPEPPKPVEQPTPQIDPKEQLAIEQISSRYGADPTFVQEVIALAKKYQKPGFPSARDIIAIIAVESEFDPEAVSGLSRDPAVGLMQVRPGVWGIDPEELKDPETAIKIGADILHKYYRHLNFDKHAAVQAYNVGLTNFRQGEDNPRYLMKYLKRMKNISPVT